MNTLITDCFAAARRLKCSTTLTATLLELDESGRMSASDLAKLHGVDYYAELMSLKRFAQLGLINEDKESKPHAYSISERGRDLIREIAGEVKKIKQTRENLPPKPWGQ